MHADDPTHALTPRFALAGAGTRNRPVFHRPPFLRDARGLIRRVGVEVEFHGIGARAAARALAAGLGGTCREEDPHAFHILDTAVGRLSVELDLRHAHPQRSATPPRLRLGATGAAWLGTLLQGAVPRELITAPLPIEALGRVDGVLDVLRAAGARGRGATPFGSLGLHFNVDPVSLDSASLTAVLKAFLLLNARLRRETIGREGGGRERGGREGGRTDGAPFLPRPYPDAYVRRVLAPDYWPDLPALVEDYLGANPTRDRDLDLLPLFLHIDPARIRARLPFEKIGSRAVFHYRLPRAHLSDPAWSIASAWNGWVAVEALAGDRDRLDALGRRHIAGHRPSRGTESPERS